MAERSAIEWTDATWTPIRARRRDSGKLGWHCEHVSEGCRHCYAEAMNRRLGTGLDFKPGHRPDIVVDEKMLLAPLRWRRPRMIFVGSMTDLFADFVTDAMLDRLFAVMALASHHTLQILTKRPARMRAYLSDERTPARIARTCVDMWLAGLVEPNDDWPVDSVGPIDMPDDLVMRFWPLPNVWLGTSCEDQATADARVPDLLATPAAIRFVSAEPLLGPIDLSKWIGSANGHSEERGGLDLSAGTERGAVDRQRRQDLATLRSPSGPLERRDENDPMRAASGGARHRQIPDGSSDGRREANDGLRPAPSMAALQRTDPNRFDRQPQKWTEEEQSSIQFGIGDAFGADDSCGVDIGVQAGTKLSWVIVGGESGPNSRPMHPAWARSIRDQCAAAGVAFFMKQMSGVVKARMPAIPDDLMIREMPHAQPARQS